MKQFLQLTITKFETCSGSHQPYYADILNFRKEQSAFKVVLREVGRYTLQGYKLSELTQDEHGNPIKVYLEKDIQEAVLIKLWQV